MPSRAAASVAIDESDEAGSESCWALLRMEKVGARSHGEGGCQIACRRWVPDRMGSKDVCIRSEGKGDGSQLDRMTWATRSTRLYMGPLVRGSYQREGKWPRGSLLLLPELVQPRQELQQL